MKNIAFITSKSGGMISKLLDKGLTGAIYSNNPNRLLERRVLPHFFKDINEVPGDYDIYVLCGYMKIIPETWLKGKKVINYHPGTVEYKGIDPQKRMIEDYSKGIITQGGGIIHYVDGGVDTGNVIYGFSENIYKDDTVGTLTNRMEVKAVNFLSEYLK